MKLTKLFTVSLGVASACVSTVHAMSMSMAPMSMKPKEPLCTMAERKRKGGRKERMALRERENNFINTLLTSHADLNNDTVHGRPLEMVHRLKTFEFLLQHGADPKLCRQSPLVRPLLYYTHRIGKNSLKEQKRRAMKIFRCFHLLLRAGTNANQENLRILPLQRVVVLDNDFDLPQQISSALLRLLIWYGANPRIVEPRSGFSTYSCARYFPSYNYFKQERQKYEAVCQLLKGYKDKDWPLNLLPPEILNEIIRYVKLGSFVPPPERSIESTASVFADVSPAIEPAPLDTSTAESEKALTTRSTNSIFRRMPIPIIIAGVAISSFAYWLSTKLKTRNTRIHKSAMLH